ncbi:hypothetical protein FGADI_5203 [Fusarium gaditjirri]|uniref:Uncharacterized protein n=1 Tax=Fusarium gaditjirri TaxID=282569 RepID=A0A8H4TAZ6_9HYPO|nr:hypothetical protein FGADI_5203 [Fusarium gaditjirri]
MSGYYNPGIPPEDENRDQFGHQGQNPGQNQYPNQFQNNGMQRSRTDPNLSYPGSTTWEPEAPHPQMPQEQEMVQIHNSNQQNAMNQTTQRNQMQNMHQTPSYYATPAPAPTYHHLFRGMDMNMPLGKAIQLPAFLKALRQFQEAGRHTGNNADACAGSVSVQNQQYGDYPRHGHTIPPPPQPSPAVPSTGGRRKRGRGASPNTTAPAPKRTRNLAPNASGAEGDNANSSGVPEPIPNIRSTPSGQPQETRKRKAGIDEEEDDLPADARPPMKKSKGDDTAAGNSRMNQKREDHEKVTPGTICDFCANHDKGKEAYAANPVCDWIQVPNVGGPQVYNVECSNCANHRSRIKDQTQLDEEGGHMCKVPGPTTRLIDFPYKRYGDRDPQKYEGGACTRCKRSGRENTCDVDTILGYFCHFCRRGGDCTVGESVMPMRRPNKLTRRPWFRHPCDRCLLRHREFDDMKGDDCCSWITNRREWEADTACKQCQRDETICLDLGTLMAPPTAPSSPLPPKIASPRNWEIRSMFEQEEEKAKKETKSKKWHEYAEVTTNTNWRKPCKACQTSGKGVNCLVMWTQAYNACERCTQFGIDCWVPVGEAFLAYPIIDLSRVGFGQFTPFKVCKQCAEAGRNCDRQRPCDSCRHHHAKCDPLGDDRLGCIDRAKIAGKGNMGSYSPGHLYYLALGYGPGGVDDIKDGQRFEHWIGPAAPVYSLADIKDRPRHYRLVADAHRHHRPPRLVFPPFIQFGQLLNGITAQQLGELITEHWVSPQPPKSDSEAYNKVWALLRDNQKLQMARFDADLPYPMGQVRSFQGGPVLQDIEINQGFLPLSLATQSQGAPQLPSNNPPNHFGYGDYQRNAPAQQIQPYGSPATGGYSQEPYQGPVVDGQEYGGLDLQQPDAYTQQTQPTMPSLDPAYQQVHGIPAEQVDVELQEGQEMRRGQVWPNQQDWEKLDQQQVQLYRGRADADQTLVNSLMKVQVFNQNSEPRPIADGSAIPPPDIENGQQELHSGSQALDQPPEAINESQDDSVDYSLFVGFDAGTDKPERSQVNRRYNIKTSRGSKRERMAPKNRAPESANIGNVFNPFLGFAFGPDQKPRFKNNPKSSRWKVFNHLEGIDMDEWHESKSKETEEEFQPRLFTIVNGQTNKPAPLRDVLGDLPKEKKKGKRTSLYCVEPGEGGRGVCGSRDTGNQGQVTCQSSAHCNTVPGFFPVCNDCTRGNVKYLFQHGHNPITEGELLSMRAYLCNDCAGQMSSGAPNAAQNQTVGSRRIYGIAADEEHSQNIQRPVSDRSQAAKSTSSTEALTGCSCANRMLGLSLCRFHRLYYAEEVMKHSALMQEWRLSRFKKAVCPSCLAQKPLEHVNVSANVDGFMTGAPTAWACVVCNDWVVNEQNDRNNQPRAIDKPLWNLNIGRNLLDLHPEITPGRVLGEEVSV